MTRRLTTKEERDEFKAAFDETRPLAADRTARTRAPDTAAKLLQPGGLDGRTTGRLKRGLIEPESRLDLHGFTAEAAHAALGKFVRSARARKERLVLVVTGRGGGPRKSDAPFDLGLDRGPRGVLKTEVPRWLAEPELAQHVAHTMRAHRRHGGEGALYIYLRKPRA